MTTTLFALLYVALTIAMRWANGATHEHIFGKPIKMLNYAIVSAAFAAFVHPFLAWPQLGLWAYPAAALLHFGSLVAFFQPAHGAVLIGNGKTPNRKAYGWADAFAELFTGMTSLESHDGSSRGKNTDALWGAARYGVFGAVNAICVAALTLSLIPLAFPVAAMLVGGVYRLAFHFEVHKGEWIGHIGSATVFSGFTVLLTLLTTLQ